MSRLRAPRFGAHALGSVFAMTLTVFVFAQASFNTAIQTTDFSGEWTEIPHEIGFTAELYDNSGLPVNAAGRMRYDTGEYLGMVNPRVRVTPASGRLQLVLRRRHPHHQGNRSDYTRAHRVSHPVFPRAGSAGLHGREAASP